MNKAQANIQRHNRRRRAAHHDYSGADLRLSTSQRNTQGPFGTKGTEDALGRFQSNHDLQCLEIMGCDLHVIAALKMGEEPPPLKSATPLKATPSSKGQSLVAKGLAKLRAKRQRSITEEGIANINKKRPFPE